VRDVVRAIRDFVPQLPQIECDFVPQESKKKLCRRSRASLPPYYEPLIDSITLSGREAPMNRLLIVLVLGALGCAMPGAAVAQSERGPAAGVTELILLFLSDISRGFLPKRVEAESKDGKKGAEPEQDARKSQEERRRDAYIRVEEQEREARKARAEYRLETRDALAERQYAEDRPGDEQARDASRVREERLRIAELRMNETEREAQKAKEEYQLVARKAREERLLEAEVASQSD
jgi:hypothetical protein